MNSTAALLPALVFLSLFLFYGYVKTNTVNPKLVGWGRGRHYRPL